MVPEQETRFRNLEHAGPARSPARRSVRSERADASERGTAIEKALDVLFHLHAAGAARGVTEIGNALDLPKSSAHRMLSALARRGLVEQDESGRYRPGTALLALGLGVLEREPVVAVARPVLEREADALGETFFLAVARAGRIVVLDKVEGRGFLRAAPPVGAVVPVHATAMGKLYLAFAPDAVSAPVPPLPRFTPRTRIQAEPLAREVARARELGWAENREEWLEGLAVVAAPVRLGTRLVAVLALAAPASRLPSTATWRVARRVVAAAEAVAARLERGGEEAATRAPARRSAARRRR